MSKDPDGGKAAAAIRGAYDQLLAGGLTGRWDYAQLEQPEKTYMGVLVELRLQAEFELDRGAEFDFVIDGVEVDCKFSQRLNGWQMPKNMWEEGHSTPALVVWASDQTGRWSMGLVRVDEARVRAKGNQDKKRCLNATGCEAVFWLHERAPLPPNLLLELDPVVRDRIFEIVNGKRPSGRERVRRLMREVQGVIIDRTTLACIAQQKDPMRRGRERSLLKKEGILILGHRAEDHEVAAALGFDLQPHKGELLSVRVVLWHEGDAEPFATIADSRWRRARAGEETCEAPELSRRPEVVEAAR